MSWLLVALGAAVGAVARYLLARRLTGVLPWGVLTANTAGSFALGGLIGVAATPDWQLLLGTGLCGALTTWSALGFETVLLVEIRERLLAILYVVASLIGGLGGALAGIAAGTALAG